MANVIVGPSAHLKVRLRVERFPYKWQLYEYVPEATPIGGEGEDEEVREIDAPSLGSVRRLAWSAVAISDDPERSVTVAAEVIDENNKVIGKITGALTVKKPGKKFFMFLPLEGGKKP